MSVPDEIYIGHGWPPYFAHAELDWTGRFDSEGEAREALSGYLEKSQKPGSTYWCIRHPHKRWVSGNWPRTKP